MIDYEREEAEWQKEIGEKVIRLVTKMKKVELQELADLCNELTMPPELRKAHQEIDKAVMEEYGFNRRSMTESACVVA